MPPADERQTSGAGHEVHFATTRWSLVLTAGQGGSPASATALANLCETYWYPLYAFVRRRGRNADDAQDLVQAFFARLVEKNDLAAAERERGRFRSFLLTSLKHFLANDWDRQRAQKRGGSQRLLSIDFGTAEERYNGEPSHELTAEKVFAHRWAMVVLANVLAQLQREFVQAGKSDTFERIKVFLTGEQSALTYGQLGADLATSEGAVKVAVHRLRKRYRELLREEIGQTLADPDPEEVDQEIRDLFAAINS
jgi:DNA-directed RNA polymerase specialized sigma24 family protein